MKYFVTMFLGVWLVGVMSTFGDGAQAKSVQLPPVQAKSVKAAVKRAPVQVSGTGRNTVTVMGVDVIPQSGLFVVTRDVNVRRGPDTKFPRVSGLKAGEKVRAIGKPKGTSWMAVSQNGETLGFVFAKMLLPVVDGTLGEQFFGSFTSPKGQKNGVACDYRFRFEGKVPVEGADFDTADYEVRFRCASQEGAAIFYAHMFLTESPVIERTGAHLIGLDVRSIGDGLEEYLTTRYLYYPKTGKVVFDGHSLPRFAVPPKVQTFQAASIKDALQRSLDLSIASWTAKAWDTLFQKGG